MISFKKRRALPSLEKNVKLFIAVMIIFCYSNLAAQIAKPTNPNPADNSSICLEYYSTNVTLSWDNPEYTARRKVSLSTDPAIPDGAQTLMLEKNPASPGHDYAIFDLEELGTPIDGRTYYWKVEVWCEQNTYNFIKWSFWNSTPGSISGFKFKDDDGDGVWDNDENPIKKWPIHLKYGTIDLIDSTDENGQYSFEIRKEGTYNVSEEDSASWDRTLPEENLYQITMAFNDGGNLPIITGKNFGNKKISRCTLISPADQEKRVDVQPNFSWQNMDNAQTIDLYVFEYDGETLIGVVHEKKGLAAAAGQKQNYNYPDNLKNSTNYAWRVVSHNTDGDFVTDDNRFRTVGPCILIDPINGKIAPRKTTFTWKNDDDAVSVKITVREKFLMQVVFLSDVIEAAAGAVQSFTVSDCFNYGTSYWWFVESTLNDGKILGTNPDSFKTGNMTTIIYPNTPNTKNIPVNTIFKWKNAYDAVTVKLVVSKWDGTAWIDVITEELAAEQPGEQTFQAPQPLEYSTKYYWAIKFGEGSCFSLAASQTFTTECRPPEKASPQNNAADVDLQPTFMWHNSTGATSVTLTVSDSSADPPKQLQYNLTVTEENQTYKIPDVLKAYTQYSWDVASDCENSSQEHVKFSFKTKSTPSEKIEPINNAEKVCIQSQFKWMNSEDAKTVTLYIYDLEGNIVTQKDLTAYPGQSQFCYLDIPLKYSVKYRWQVIIHSESGDSQAGDGWYFTTSCKPIEIVVPSSGAHIKTPHPTIIWRNSEDTKIITIQFSYYEITGGLETYNYTRNYEGPLQGYTIPDELAPADEMQLTITSDCQCGESSTTFNANYVRPEHTSPKEGETNINLQPEFELKEFPNKLEIWKDYNSSNSVRSKNHVILSGDYFTYELPADTTGTCLFCITDSLEYSTWYKWTITTYYDSIIVPSDTNSFKTMDPPTDIKEFVEIPAKYILDQNYPNPFNPTTVISYYLPAESEVEIKIHNIIGKEIAILAKGKKQSGYYQVEWNASEMPSGVYFYSLRAFSGNNSETFYEVKKMILLR